MGYIVYFTRRPANVVRDYIRRYSVEGDMVLDPFGGTGVTAIEAFLLGRSAIQNDLNPFANFIARNIADTTLSSTAPLRQAFERVEQTCCKQVREIERDEAVAKRWLQKLPLPENIRLPRNSDADFFIEMFTPRQLAGLALIKQAIESEDGVIRDLLLLAWSASVAKLNKTFLSAKGRAESRGGSSIFSIYRYKLAARSVELPIWETFHGRFLNVLAAKKEVFERRDYQQQAPGGLLNLDSKKNFRVLAHDAATLDKSSSRAAWIIFSPIRLTGRSSVILTFQSCGITGLAFRSRMKRASRKRSSAASAVIRKSTTNKVWGAASKLLSAF